MGYVEAFVPMKPLANKVGQAYVDRETGDL